MSLPRRDIVALSDILADKHYFFGDSPSLTDATVYSLLANIYAVEFNSPMKAMLEQTANLPPFIQRFKAEYYGDDTAQ